MSRFDGSVAWITGGGSGIGHALALELARQGADVAVSGRRQERLEAVVGEIEALGRRGLAVTCDVADEASVAAAVDAVVAEFGKLDVAVANAGWGLAGRFETLTADDWRRQFDVNVIGAATTIRTALPELHKTQGRAVFISSVMGFLTMSGQGAYAASKFAVRAMGLTLSQELHGSGVSCTTISPGFVESEIAQVDNQGRFRPERKDRRPQQFMWPADKAARVMAKAIADRKREYVFTGHGKVAAFLGKHAPGLIHFAATRQGAKKKVAAGNKNAGN